MIRNLILNCLLLSSQTLAIGLYTDFPLTINSNEHYVFYSHGLILEGNSPRPVHPEYGAYEFEKIKEAIFFGGDFNLIAHHRPADTNINEYVKTLEGWVRQLINAGVKPSKITLVGFSRGSHLTALASHKLNKAGINTVLLASCMQGDIPFETPITLGGNLLSIYETSDVMGPCSNLAQRSDNLQSFKEVAISTGLTHGAFFLPLDDWIMPLKEWIAITSQ